MNRMEKGSDSRKRELEQAQRNKRLVANSYERQRMHGINRGFEALRAYLAPTEEDNNMSKAAILHKAAAFIQVLLQEKCDLTLRNAQLVRMLYQQRPVENPVPVYRGVDKSVPVYRGVDKSVPVYRGVDNPVPVYRGVDNPVPVYRGVDKSAQNSLNKLLDKPMDKPLYKPMDKPPFKSADKPVENSLSKLLDKPVDKPLYNPMENPLFNLTGKPVYRPMDKPMDKPVEKLFKEPVGKPKRSRKQVVTSRKMPAEPTVNKKPGARIRRKTMASKASPALPPPQPVLQQPQVGAVCTVPNCTICPPPPPTPQMVNYLQLQIEDLVEETKRLRHNLENERLHRRNLENQLKHFLLQNSTLTGAAEYARDQHVQAMQARQAALSKGCNKGLETIVKAIEREGEFVLTDGIVFQEMVPTSTFPGTSGSGAMAGEKIFTPRPF